MPARTVRTPKKGGVNHRAELVSTESLKPFPGNPRRGDVQAIAESLKANGQYRPLVVRQKTREVLAGNHTLLAARELGWDEVWATFVDVDARQARRIVLVDNRTNDLADYDYPRLAEMLGELPSLDGTGYGPDDLERLIRQLAPAGPGADTEPREPPADPRTKPGDLWLLGEHRLLCGDSTVATDVERLLGGGVPNLTVTDPPYGVDYDPAWRQRAAEAG